MHSFFPPTYSHEVPYTNVGVPVPRVCSAEQRRLQGVQEQLPVPMRRSERRQVTLFSAANSGRTRDTKGIN